MFELASKLNTSKATVGTTQTVSTEKDEQSGLLCVWDVLGSAPGPVNVVKRQRRCA